MSTSNIRTQPASVPLSPIASSSQKVRSTSLDSFSDTLTNELTDASVTASDVRRFFASNPSSDQIADQASKLHLSKDQIVKTLAAVGYSGGDGATLTSQVERYIAGAGADYRWDSEGRLLKMESVGNGGVVGSEKAMPSAADIKVFFASNPSEKQVTEKAKALGLSASQMVKFQATGMGVDVSQMSAHVLETLFAQSAEKLGENIGGGAHGSWTSYFSPALGRAVTKAEMQDFFAKKPDQGQVFQKAASLGLGIGAVNNMMQGLGIPEDTSVYGSRYNQMATSLYQGRDGFSLDAKGRIVSGGGNQFLANADGSGSWTPKV